MTILLQKGAMTKADLIVVFEREFNTLKHLFKVESFNPKEHGIKPAHDDWARPGVYIYLKGNQAIKVGKSQTNSFKRSLEHIRDNTSSKDGVIQMRDLGTMEDVLIVLINVKNQQDDHWVPSLEYYMEKELNPLIKSGRRG